MIQKTDLISVILYKDVAAVVCEIANSAGKHQYKMYKRFAVVKQGGKTRLVVTDGKRMLVYSERQSELDIEEGIYEIKSSPIMFNRDCRVLLTKKCADYETYVNWKNSYKTNKDMKRIGSYYRNEGLRITNGKVMMSAKLLPKLEYKMDVYAQEMNYSFLYKFDFKGIYEYYLSGILPEP